MSADREQACLRACRPRDEERRRDDDDRGQRALHGDLQIPWGLQPGEGAAHSASSLHGFEHLFPRIGKTPHTLLAQSMFATHASRYRREPGAIPVSIPRVGDRRLAIAWAGSEAVLRRQTLLVAGLVVRARAGPVFAGVAGGLILGAASGDDRDGAENEAEDERGILPHGRRQNSCWLHLPSKGAVANVMGAFVGVQVNEQYVRRDRPRAEGTRRSATR